MRRDDMPMPPPPPVEGAKKGGGRAATEVPDSLRSTQRAELLDLLCEGPIQGLVNGMESVFLDGVPIENPDGSRNFDVLDFGLALGTQGQAAMHGFDAVQNEQGVSVKVTTADPVVRSILAGAADRVRVTLGIPQLSTSDTTTGDLKGAELEFAIDVQQNGGGFVERYRRKVTGKAMTRFQPSVVLDLARNTGPWDVRVRRITADSTSTALVNELWWDSYTEIQSARLRYPNSALAGLSVSASQFSRIPTRGYDLLLKIVQVPNNYDPITRAYTGTWDGTFKPAWTNNPAWVFYDIVTNTRYGLGRYVDPSLLSKWALYRIAQYCDGLVPDGRGGWEPRFSCNLYLQTRADALQVLRDMAGIFRGIVGWGASSLEVVQDAPDDALHLYTPANVKDGKFRYESTSRKTKKSGCVVWWINLANKGKREPLFHQDPDLVAKYGVENMELSPLGCTSPGQALRLAKWALYSEETEGELVRFSVGTEGALVPLGRVFKIADPTVAGERLGGRISAASTTEVTLDADVTLQPGEGYTLSVMVPNPADPFALVTHERAVTNAAGTARVITLASALPEAPPTEAIWMLQSTAVAATSWRCLGVRELEDGSGYDVTGVAHNPSKYDAIELGLKLESLPVSRLREDAPRPTNLQLVESVYTTANIARSKLTLSWMPAAPGLRYLVSWRSNNSTWQSLPQIDGQGTELPDVPPGLLDVEVRSINPLGAVSPALAGSATVTGRAELLIAPTSITITELSNGMRRATVTLPDALPSDVAGLRIKANAGAFVAQWSTQTLLTPQIVSINQAQAGQVVTVDLFDPAPGTWSFATRLVDTSGNEGAVGALVQNVTLGERYTGDLDATKGAQAGSNLTDSGGQVLGDDDVKNIALEMRPDGTLWGPQGSQGQIALGQLEGALQGSQLAEELATPIAAIPAMQATLADAAGRINAIEPIVVDLAPKVATLEPLLPQTAELGANLAQLSTALSSVSLKLHGTDVMLRDAGFAVDPASGKVTISGIEQTAEQLNQVQVQLDAQAATIALKASAQYVDQQIAAAGLDGAGQVAFDALDVRLTAAQVEIDGVAATVATKADSVTVNAQGARLATAEETIDGLAGQIALKADTTVVDGINTRLSTAETTLSAIDGSSSLITDLQAGNYQLQESDAQAAATTIQALLALHQQGQDVNTALAAAHEEITAKINGDVSAEAAQRLLLAAQVAGNAAAISSESQARSDADTALATQVTTLQAANATTSAAVQTEATARTAADAALSQQITSLQSTVAGNTASIAGEATARAAGDSAIASQVTTLQAGSRLADVADGEGAAALVQALIAVHQQGQDVQQALAYAHEELTTKTNADVSAEAQQRLLLAAQVAANAAAIETESTARVDGDSALASQVTTLQAASASNIAAVQAETTARTDADTALAQQITTLQSSVDSNSGAITSEATARASADTALAQQITTLQSTVAGNTSAITSEATARASADTALSQQITNLQTTVAGNTGAIASEATARANGDSANAQAITTLQSTVTGQGTALASVQELASTSASEIDGLQAQYTLKAQAVRSDGKVVLAFVGLAASANNSGSQSEILLAAEKLTFVPLSDPNATPEALFTTGVVNGQPALIVRNLYMGDGEIRARNIEASAVTADKLAANAVTAGKIKAGEVQAQHLAVNSLSAISADLGTVTAGVVRNATDSVNLNLNATGTSLLLRGGGYDSTMGGYPIEVHADGVGRFSRRVASGTWSGSVRVYTQGDPEYGGGQNGVTFDIDTGYNVPWQVVHARTFDGRHGVMGSFMWPASQFAAPGNYAETFNVRIQPVRCSALFTEGGTLNQNTNPFGASGDRIILRCTVEVGLIATTLGAGAYVNLTSLAWYLLEAA